MQEAGSYELPIARGSYELSARAESVYSFMHSLAHNFLLVVMPILDKVSRKGLWVVFDGKVILESKWLV